MKKTMSILGSVLGILLICVACIVMVFCYLSPVLKQLVSEDKIVILYVIIFTFVLLGIGLIIYSHALKVFNNTLPVHLILCNSVWFSASVTYKVKKKVDKPVSLTNGTLQIKGILNNELLNAFYAVAENNDFSGVKVKVRSPGGRILVGMIIGREIYRHQLDVEVDGYCISSCANYLFTAGNNKYLQSADHLQFHGGSLQPNFVDAAFSMVREKKQMENFDDSAVPNAPELRKLYGLRKDHPFNPASSILAEVAYFKEIGINPIIPVYGQYGDYAKWFNDGIHDLYFFLEEDFKLLGIKNVHIAEPYQDNNDFEESLLFRAKVNQNTIDSMSLNLMRIVGEIENSMSFDIDEVWVEQER